MATIFSKEIGLVISNNAHSCSHYSFCIDNRPGQDKMSLNEKFSYINVGKI